MDLNCFTWFTTKTPDGFKWCVWGYHNADISKKVYLHEGICPTRARAVLQAKKHVIIYRRSVK